MLTLLCSSHSNIRYNTIYDIKWEIWEKTEQTPKHSSEYRNRGLRAKSWDPLQRRVPFVHTFGGLVLCLCAIEFPFDYNICAVFGSSFFCNSVCVHRFEKTLFRNECEWREGDFSFPFKSFFFSSSANVQWNRRDFVCISLQFNSNKFIHRKEKTYNIVWSIFLLLPNSLNQHYRTIETIFIFLNFILINNLLIWMKLRFGCWPFFCC